MAQGDRDSCPRVGGQEAECEERILEGRHMFPVASTGTASSNSKSNLSPVTHHLPKAWPSSAGGFAETPDINRSCRDSATSLTPLGSRKPETKPPNSHQTLPPLTSSGPPESTQWLPLAHQEPSVWGQQSHRPGCYLVDREGQRQEADKWLWTEHQEMLQQGRHIRHSSHNASGPWLSLWESTAILLHPPVICRPGEGPTGQCVHHHLLPSRPQWRHRPLQCSQESDTGGFPFPPLTFLTIAAHAAGEGTNVDSTGTIAWIHSAEDVCSRDPLDTGK